MAWGDDPEDMVYRLEKEAAEAEGAIRALEKDIRRCEADHDASRAELERLRAAVRSEAADLLAASQANDCRIREAGVMQFFVNRLLELAGPQR